MSDREAVGIGIYLNDGKLEYEEPVANFRTAYNVAKAIRYYLSRGYFARMEAECWPSDWLKIIDELSGFRQYRPGFKPDKDSFLDFLYTKLKRIRKSDLNFFTLDDLELILCSLAEINPDRPHALFEIVDIDIEKEEFSKKTEKKV